ncbi:5-bromo-4-chloroindolyl phosphate hydrolysis protein [Hasllibacter halocynthiae]|uniref:5-bromo-4-chloroindolyl phosphate hydrolysis protein n=1 Tax=Hasllibacter halocynthiae TaxID=595589 RepID=A0A2T0X6J3_9RHOB|nr:5-bromo-4-chloroindolyl phosphate hydrolysis family protein [Hasllibacter halocynthiae]PRY94543.1 5-bromo-4-chloroindolyl phosphate hydrolysis protein [Hasllibacter halocynthiae]
MARRYGGRYSPKGGGTGAPDAPSLPELRQGPVGLRANLLWVPPAVLTLTAFLSGGAALLGGLAGAGLLFLCAWLTREGLQAEAAFDAREVARRPAIPRKLFGSAAAGLGVAAATVPAGAPLTGVLLGVLAAALHLAAFGPDPLRDKGAKGADALQSGRVADAVGEAEAKLAAARGRLVALRDREATERFDAFAAEAGRLFRQVEADPADYAGARKHLGVYLQAAHDATEKFVALQSRAPSPDARASYLSLLDDLRGGYAQRTETLMLDDRTGMDVEIDVLRDRLRREGIKVE